MVMNSKTYTAYLPVKTPDFTAPPPSIVRARDKNMPVYDVSSPDIACGQNAQPLSDDGVSRVGAVTAGTNIKFYWGKGFPHAGPVTNFMAKCEPDCGSFTGIGEKSWFKVDEQKYVDGDGWPTTSLATTGYVEMKVPECLAPGEYLVRHEIISLSECHKKNRCQLYPGCAQIKVEGKGTVRPKDLVAFPGAYKNTDPGILFNSNAMDWTDYTPPGPLVFQCP